MKPQCFAHQLLAPAPTMPNTFSLLYSTRMPHAKQKRAVPMATTEKMSSKIRTAMATVWGAE